NSEWTNASDGIFRHLNDRAISAVVMVPDIHQLFARYLSGPELNMPTRGILEVGCSPLAHPLPSGYTDFGDNSQLLFADSRTTTPADMYTPGKFRDHSWGYVRCDVHDDRM